MEFEDVGSHCSLPSCKQKDFLPFTCDTCHRKYCLSHRSYEAHGCEGGLRKDMTSLDCPICAKSIKFDKSKDPNDVWEEHYTKYCTQQRPPTSNQTSQKCARKDCLVHLGPSNTYQCPKCLKKVCLSHRMSEEHECLRANSRVSQKEIGKNPRETIPSKAETRPGPANPREAFLAKFESKSSSSSSSSATKKSAPTSKPSSRTTNIKSSAAPQSKSEFKCPMCSMDCGSLEQLSRHVEGHLLNENTQSATSSSSSQPIDLTSPSSSSQPRGGIGIERCPICNREFSDPVELVNHVELVHNRVEATSSSSSSSQPNPSESTCTLA